MSRKTVAFVLEAMYIAGAEKALIEVLNAFDYKNYDVTLWLRDDSGAMQSFLDPRVKIKYWGCSNTRLLFINQIKTGKISHITRGIFYRALSRVFISEYDLNALYSTKCLPPCSDFVYDCVVAYQILSPAVVATALYRLNGKKKVLWVHGRNVRPSKLNRFFDHQYDKFDLIPCVSESTRQEFGRDFPKSMKKTATIYNLFNEKEIVKKADQPINCELKPISLVTVGRLVSVKGQSMIPQITQLLQDAGHDVHWYLVGDGPLRETIKEEMEKCGVSDRVHLLGTQINPYPYIKNCDIYVQTSFSEGYCTTTTEAKILGKPVVTTDAPGMREQFVNGKNGIIVDSMSPESIYEGINCLLTTPGLKETFIENLSLETFDNTNELQKLYRFIED